MNLSISIDNFNERKEYTLTFVGWYIIISAIGTVFIAYNSPYLQTTYFTSENIFEYLKIVFNLFYPIVVLIFVLSHIRIEKEGSEED